MSAPPDFEKSRIVQPVLKRMRAYIAKAESQQAKESNVSENKYQGYKNYETWNVALWASNDDYHYYQELAADIKARIENGDCDQVNDETWTAEQAARFLLADEIEEALTTTHPLADDATMYSDLMNHALGQVDWDEVAGSILEE